MTQADNTYPLVSVYIPTKNRSSLLQRAVDSVFAQTYPNIELIICDDGSTDDTSAFTQSLTPKGSVKFIKTLANATSKGACHARNQAIASARGDFVTGLDDDDLFQPERISLLIAAYEPKYAFVCSAMIWDNGPTQKVIDNVPGIYHLSQQLDYNEATTQVLVEKQRVLAVGGFDETFVACQDYDLWTRLMLAFGPLKRIAEPTYVINNTDSTQRLTANPKSAKGYDQFFSKHGHLMSWKNRRNQNFMKLRRLRKRYPMITLIIDLGSGHIAPKVRYFLRSNLGFLLKK